MRKGFTLIELLIVIIIIGILATMAVPQYKRMVNRARWAEAMQLAGEVKNAMGMYAAELGAVPITWAQLNGTPWVDSIPLPATRKCRFTITGSCVYAVSAIRMANDGTAVAALPYFAINLNDNTTSYGGSPLPPGNF